MRFVSTIRLFSIHVPTRILILMDSPCKMSLRSECEYSVSISTDSCESQKV